jgi:hypothetical protein
LKKEKEKEGWLIWPKWGWPPVWWQTAHMEKKKKFEEGGFWPLGMVCEGGSATPKLADLYF